MLGEEEKNTTVEQCFPGPHATLRIPPPSLGLPGDPGRLWTNLTFVSEHIIFELHNWHCFSFVTQGSSPFSASLQIGQ